MKESRQVMPKTCTSVEGRIFHLDIERFFYSSLEKPKVFSVIYRHNMQEQKKLQFLIKKSSLKLSLINLAS